MEIRQKTHTTLSTDERPRQFALIVLTILLAGLTWSLAAGPVQAAQAQAVPVPEVEPHTVAGPGSTAGGFVVSSRANDQLRPALAYGSQSDLYLVVWEDEYSLADHDIYGKLVGTDGSLLSEAFAISTAAANETGPRVAYNWATGQFLVVWDYQVAAGDHDVYGQLVADDGQLVGSALPLAVLGMDEGSPDVTYNPSDMEFLLVYERVEGQNEYLVYGQRLGNAGDGQGDPFAINSVSAESTAPAAAHGWTDNRYLVVWQNHDGSEYDLLGRMVAADGTLEGGELAFAAWQADQIAPRLAYNPIANQFLVTWEVHHFGDDWDVYGQRANSDGTLEAPFLISGDSANHRLSPDVAYQPDVNEYFVTWEYEFSAGDHDVIGRRVAADDSLPGDEISLSNLSSNESRPAIAAVAPYAAKQPASQWSFLTLWVDGRDEEAQGLDIYGDVVDLLPDLVMESLAAEPNPVRSEEPAVFTAEVHNAGLLPVDNVPLRFEAGGDPFAEPVIDQLGPNAVEFISVTHVFSASGQISVTATVNPDGALPEQTLANNQQEVAVEVVWEESPGWSRPDLALAGMTATPRRPDPGQTVVITAELSNPSNYDVVSATIALRVDGLPVDEGLEGDITAWTKRSVELTWDDPTPGRHQVDLVVDPLMALTERKESNNLITGWIRVSGEENPLPDLAVAEIIASAIVFPDLDQGAAVSATISNEGYAPAVGLPVLFTIDGYELGRTTIESLGPGQATELAFEWLDPGEGQHVIGVWIDPDDQIPDDNLSPGSSQSVVTPGANYEVAANVGLGHWELAGPRSINNGAYSGRIDSIAISQQHSNNISIGAPAGGVWRTRDGGTSWWPQTDHLESPGFGAVALDPSDDTIIYAGSGGAYGGGSGLYKSLDEGAHWSKFAGVWLSDGYTGLILRHTQPTTLTLYAATRRGVWLWEGDPDTTTSVAGDWQAIWQQNVAGADQRVGDMLITAENPPQLYWTVGGDSIYRVNANDPLNATVERLSAGLPADLSYANIGNSAADSDRVYAAVKRSSSDLDIYRRDHSGNWIYRGRTPKSCADYNAFIGVHPSNANILYIGGVKGCRSSDGGATFPYPIPNVHDDYKSYAFDPASPNTIFFTSDGGVYRCDNNASIPMNCYGLNHDLATTMFFDIALAASDVNRIVGGTQDNGSIIGDNSLDWTNLSYGGDGKYMLIDPADRNTMFAQYQYINSVVSSTVAGKPWPAASAGLPTLNVDRYDPIMIMDPNDSHTLLAAANQVYRTTNRGKQWTAIGPMLAIDYNGEIIKRIAIDGSNQRYYAGTNRGRLFTVAANDAAPLSWTQIYTHPYGSAIRGILVDPTNANRLYLTAASGGAWRVLKLVHSGGWPGTWTASDITGGAPAGLAGNRRVNGGINDAIRGLIKHPSADILYIGTDRGVYEGRQVSGAWQWLPDSCGLPLTYVSDLELHTGGIMRAATYGRSAYERPTTLLTINPDAYDTPTRNDTRASAAALPAIPESKALMPNLTVDNLNLDRLNDVDYYTIQLPPATTSKGYAECLPQGDSRLNDPRTTQGAFAIEIHAPDAPDPYELRLYKSDGSLFKEYDAISNLSYLLTCPNASFPGGQITLSVRSPTGCRGQYDLYIWYNRWYIQLDAPEILYDPPLIKRLIPALDQFHWMFPGDPALIDHAFTDGVTDPLPGQRAIFHWDHTRDFQATLTTEAGKTLNVTLVDASGAPVQQAGKTAAAPSQINAANLPAGWYALDFEDGDFPTYFDVSFNVVAGDFDGDCQVGVADLIEMAGRWNSRVDEEGYELQFDLNMDGAVDVADLLALAGRWGNACP